MVEKVSKLENEGKVIRRDPDFSAIVRFILKYKSQTPASRLKMAINCAYKWPNLWMKAREQMRHDSNKKHHKKTKRELYKKKKQTALQAKPDSDLPTEEWEPDNEWVEADSE